MTPDLLIVGAGPAGIAAATEASARGLSVVVLDENTAPGGRIWQALEKRGAETPEDRIGLETIRAFRSSKAEALFGASVWAIEPDGTVFFSHGGTAQSVRPERILLATGATERPLPIPGWTLPGVMTVGAAQIALKTAGVVPDEMTWIAGQGPLLSLFAVQTLRAGGRLAGILDLSDTSKMWDGLRHLPAALANVGELAKGLGWMWQINRAGIKWIHAANIRAEGDGRLERIVFDSMGHTSREPATTLLLHDGIVPSVQITRALGLEHRWDEAQQCWHPVTGEWGKSSIPHVWLAGDGARIGNAIAAVHTGRIAALGIADDLGRIDAATRDAAAAPERDALRKQLALRPLLDTLFRRRPPAYDDATIVCRCEEVTAGQIKSAAAQGCLGLNQLKAYTRSGMGPCQGRMCAPSAAEVLAAARGVPIDRIEPYRTRFPTKPLTVGELAGV